MKKYDLKVAASKLSIGPNQLTRLLENEGIFIRDCNGNRIPEKEYKIRNLFTVEIVSVNVGTHFLWRNKTYVTEKGMAFLAEFIAQHKHHKKSA